MERLRNPEDLMALFTDRDSAIDHYNRVSSECADAKSIHFWLLGLGRDRQIEGDDSARRTADYLLKKNGWTLDELDRWMIDPTTLPSSKALRERLKRMEAAQGKSSVAGRFETDLATSIELPDLRMHRVAPASPALPRIEARLPYSDEPDEPWERGE
jgi:hypothetical protein